MNGNLMEKEISAQPSLLGAHSERYRKTFESALSGKDFDLVVFAARGTSDHAALFARYLIEIRLGIPVSLAAPSVLTVHGRHLKYKNALVVGISQSGSAPDVSEVVESARKDGQTTVAVTNGVGSRLANAAEHVLELGVGKEESVAATKTFTATLLALYHMVRALDPTLPEPVLPTDAWTEECRQQAQSNTGVLVRCSPLFAVGRGYGFSTASETAIKLIECALLPCKSYSSADFQHGPKALAGPGSAIIDFTRSLEATLGQPSEFITPPATPSGVPPECEPLWQVIYGQWSALFASRARGLDADEPRFLTKVTLTT